MKVFWRVVNGYFKNDCPLAAAAIAYYVLLSIFPLLLLVIAIGSELFPHRFIERQLIDFVTQYAAGSEKTVTSMVRGLGRHRTSFGFVGLGGIILSGSGLFGALRTALNQAWGVKETRSFSTQRILELALAFVVGMLFVVSSLLTWLVDDPLLKLALGPGVAFVGFTLCYELIPNFNARTWRASAAAGLAATLLFEVAKWLFLAYLNGAANYNLLYGALSVVIVFLVWAYATASILLFGGQLARELETLG
jgi:membrane protein